MPSDTVNLTDEVVLRIQGMITLKGLGVGDVLGTEADIKAQLGVSRTIVREAVSRLKALGVLDSKQRVGLVVAKPDPVYLFEQGLGGELFDDLDLRELSVLRYTLEIGAVDLVIKRATDEEIESLVAVANKLIQNLENGNDARLTDEIELNFHQMLLKMSKSSMLTRMCRILASYFKKVHSHSNDSDGTKSKKSAWEHVMIAEALRDRNGELAKSMVSRHLESLLK